MNFDATNLPPSLLKALSDMGFSSPTPIQQASFNPIASGRDLVGIAQTGTGKTFAYMLPILKQLKFSKQNTPRVLILVPTRELVIQGVEVVESLSKYLNNRVLGVYGGVNINPQKEAIMEGVDILIATPGRLYDLILSRVLQLKNIRQLVVDEVDMMLDLGFKYQLINIFDNLPERRQNILFSATMTEIVDGLIDTYFKTPTRVSVALSGAPLETISQYCYEVPNFYTKVNLLKFLIKDAETFRKVLIFVAHKRMADRLFELLSEDFQESLAIIHSNKTQNYRRRSIAAFKAGERPLLIATDVMARGLDIDDISHVINFDTPVYPENYIHRIGRTGRGKQQGVALLFSTEKELENRHDIEVLMQQPIAVNELPEHVSIATELIASERPKIKERHNPTKTNDDSDNEAFHEKKPKNKKQNQGGSYQRIIAKKYKKPKTRGDKNYNRRKKRK